MSGAPSARRGRGPSPVLDGESVLEAGLLIFLLGCLGGLATLLFGRAAGQAQRSRRQAEARPTPGSVAAERHHNTGGASAR